MADALALTPISVLWIAYAVAALGLVPLVLRARPITAGNLALVAILLQQAWASGASVVRLTATDPRLALDATLWSIPAWMLWAPLAFLAGPLLLGKAPHARLARMLGAAGALPGLALLVAWFVARDLVLRPDLTGLTDAASAVLVSVFLGFAFSVAVLAREALTTPLPVRRAQFALLAAAFSVEGAFHAMQATAKLALGHEFFGQVEVGLLLGIVTVAPVLVFLGVAGHAGLVSWRHGEADARRWARILMGFVLASMLTGLAAAPVPVANEVTDPAGAFHALWDLTALGLIVFAGLRFQLFTIERQAQRGVALTSALVVLFLAWNALQEVAEGWLADMELLAGLPASGIVAATLVGAMALPVASGGRRLASRLFPQLGRHDYERQRKLAIYTAALEGALADGVASPSEVASLRRLREALGLDEADHVSIEAQVRARLEQPPSRPAPLTPRAA